MRALAVLLLVLWPVSVPAQEFPQRFTHMYGETVVPAKPARVVSLSFVGHDDLLAVGVVPVALRHWYGPYDKGVWPWAAPSLGDATPVILRGEISFEQIAMLGPDLIFAVSSGISAQDYRMLSRIAPTIASEARHGDYNTPWEDRALTVGRITGQQAEVRARIDAIHDRMAAIRAAHPQWAGMSAAAAALVGSQPSAFLPGDMRADIFSGLGFKVPDALERHRGEGFYIELSAEDPSALDADLLYWIGGTASGAMLDGLRLRPSMRAFREGREAWADEVMGGAMGHATLLSLPFILDHIPVEIDAAVDGDPDTPVPSAVRARIAP